MPKKKEAEGPVDLKKQLVKLGCRIPEELDDFNSPYYLSTGIFSLDLILTADNQKGGLGTGCVEVFGEEGGGKSSLGMSLIAEAQSHPDIKTCAYVNMERAVTKSFIQCFPKVDPSKVVWVEPNHGQDAFNAMEIMLKVQKNCLIILDSVPACITSAQVEEGAEAEFYAPIPKLLNTFMPKAKTYCRKNNSTLVLLNQLRDNMDRANKYSPRDRVPGGRAIKFFSDWRIALKIKDKIKEGDERIGHMVQAMVVKNRANKPYQTATFPLIYGHGFSCGLDLLELCLQLTIIKRNGAWYEYGAQRFQGSAKMAAWIDSDSKVQEELKTKILKAVR